MNHDWEVTDVCGDSHVLRDRSDEEAMGAIGPAYPCTRDGVSGRLRHRGDKAVFRPDHARLVQ